MKDILGRGNIFEHAVDAVSFSLGRIRCHAMVRFAYEEAATKVVSLSFSCIKMSSGLHHGMHGC